jgi:hypothetical protein
LVISASLEEGVEVPGIHDKKDGAQAKDGIKRKNFKHSNGPPNGV